MLATESKLLTKTLLLIYIPDQMHKTKKKLLNFTKKLVIN